MNGDSVACFIPIKRRSTRVPSKNLRNFRGRPLYQWIIDHVLEAAVFNRVYVDTDVAEVGAWAADHGCIHLIREAELASDDANGNDLMRHWRQRRPDHDFYFQAFATAPLLAGETIRQCVSMLMDLQPNYDSILTTTYERGWFWNPGPGTWPQPINFRPGILPRSQDAAGIIKETTGLYGITAAALARYGARHGARPFFFQVTANEAIDLDTELDFTSGGADLGTAAGNATDGAWQRPAATPAHRPLTTDH